MKHVSRYPISISLLHWLLAVALWVCAWLMDRSASF